MPKEFQDVWHYSPSSKKLIRLLEGTGEQADPIVLATQDSQFAMGIYSPDQPSKGYETVGYGRFHFEKEQVNKWNVVFRYRNEKGIPADRYTFRNFVIIGHLADVEQTMTKLIAEFK